MKQAFCMAVIYMLVAVAGTAQDDPMKQLLGLRRVHVEKLAGGETATQIRDMIISAFQRTGLFVLTEDPERADALLKGSAEDLIFNETHQTADSINARGSVRLGTPRSSTGGYAEGRGLSMSSSAGENESSRIVERRHEAMASVRLVNRDGDVLWSTTQESKGAKFRGASADVADKVTQQLLADFERMKKHLNKAGTGSDIK